MIYSILHQIWNQRRSNGWLFAELLIVFTLMWYCVDVLYGFTHAERQPKGYDLENVYKVNISRNPTQLVLCNSEDSLQQFWFKPLEEIFRRIKQHPAVESAAMWLGTDTYTRGTVYQGYSTDSTRVIEANVRYVSPEYFTVMRIPIEQGSGMFASAVLKDDASVSINATFESDAGSSLLFSSGEWNPTASPQPAVVTRDLADSLFHTSGGAVGREFMDYYNYGFRYRVSAVCALQKTDDYARYQPFILTPFPSWFYESQYIPFISIRIRPDMDTNDFAARFIQEMTSQLQVAPFYLFDVRSYKEQKIERDAAEGITSYVRSARLIVIFFVFNVFIGLMGTFWFRTRHRRSEIALRMAMGSSRKKIRWQLLGEGLLLLVIAAVPALIICINMVLADVTFTEATDASWGRFASCVLVVLALMALMVIVGIWYPASKAMRVHTAEALHDE